MAYKHVHWHGGVCKINFWDFLKNNVSKFYLLKGLEATYRILKRCIISNIGTQTRAAKSCSISATLVKLFGKIKIATLAKPHALGVPGVVRVRCIVCTVSWRKNFSPSKVVFLGSNGFLQLFPGRFAQKKGDFGEFFWPKFPQIWTPRLPTNLGTPQVC